MTEPDEMKLMLRNAREDIEEVDLVMRLRGASKELSAKRKKLEDKISTLSGFLSVLDTEKAEEVDLEALAREAEEAELKRQRSGGCGEITKMAVTILKNTISGLLTIYLYFMDLKSDYQVTKLYYDTGAMTFAAVSASLLVGQFVVIWSRVLPYLHVTYGADSTSTGSSSGWGCPSAASSSTSSCSSDHLDCSPSCPCRRRCASSSQRTPRRA